MQTEISCPLHRTSLRVERLPVVAVRDPTEHLWAITVRHCISPTCGKGRLAATYSLETKSLTVSVIAPPLTRMALVHASCNSHSTYASSSSARPNQRRAFAPAFLAPYERRNNT